MHNNKFTEIFYTKCIVLISWFSPWHRHSSGAFTATESSFHCSRLCHYRIPIHYARFLEASFRFTRRFFGSVFWISSQLVSIQLPPLGSLIPIFSVTSELYIYIKTISFYNFACFVFRGRVFHIFGAFSFTTQLLFSQYEFGS